MLILLAGGGGGGGSPSNGSANITLADFTVAATAAVQVSGSTNATLADFTVSATGTVLVSGSASPTLAGVTTTATGTVLVTGTASPTLADATVAATAAVLVTGTASPTLDDFTTTSTGEVYWNATASFTLDDFTVAATGAVLVSGSASPSLDDFTLDATGAVLISCSANLTFDANFIYAEGVSSSITPGGRHARNAGTMPNTSAFNTGLLNDGTDVSYIYGGQYARTSVKYTLEIRSKTGGLVALLPAFWGGTYTARLNQAHELTFNYDATDEFAAYLTTAYQIWLRDDTGRLVQRFRINKSVHSRDGVRAVVELTCVSILSQWYDEWVRDYSATDTVLNHLKAWFALQQHSLPLRLGNIYSGYAATSLTFDVNASRVRNVFGDIYDAIGGGDFWVEPETRRLHWQPRSGHSRGQRIRYGLNAKGIYKTEDNSEQFTRLYLYGAGNTVTDAVKLTDAGEPAEYVEANTGTYGIITEVRFIKDCRDATTLLAIANALLARYSTPTVSYEVDAVDYSASNDGGDFSFERLELGSTVRVIDDVLDIEQSCKVVEIIVNLDNPLQTKVTLDNKPKDIKYVIRDILERVEVLENTPLTLSDDLPPDVGTPAVGVSTVPARGDHTHGIDPDAIADIIATDPAVQAAITDIAGTGSADVGDNVQAVGEANDPGVSAAASREDHVHKGHHYAAADVGSLTAEAEGCDGVTTGTDKRAYVRLNSSWYCLSHLE